MSSLSALFDILTEDTSQMDKLHQHLQKIGYPKFKNSTRTTVLVYVPKSDRATAMDDIAAKLGGEIDKSPVTMRKISSLGGIKFDSGPYKGLLVGIKPDASKSLTTDEQETLNAIFIATKLAHPQTDYSFDELQKFGDRDTVSKFKIADLYEKAGTGWIKSCTTVAETLYPLYKGNKYKIHQRSGSKFEANISAAAKKLIKQSGHVMGLDKWNPADIWMVKQSAAGTNFNQFKSIQDLNTWVEEMFDKKAVVGVSLKQVGKKAKTEVFNKGNGADTWFIDWDVGKTGFIKAMNATVHFHGGSYVMRSFGRPTSINAEINGKLAQGGKVGSGPLFNIVKRFDRRFNTWTHQQIGTMFRTDAGKAKIFSRLYEQMKKLEPQTARKYDAKSLGETILSKSNPLIYCISKIQSNDIILATLKMPKKRRDELVAAIISYASSSTEISSVFIKVS